MDLDSVLKNRLKQENTASEQIKEALNTMRSDVEKKNEEIAERLRPKEPKEEAALDQEERVPKPKLENRKVEKLSEIEKKPLVYFSFQPSYDFPPWVLALRQILVQTGYFVFNPVEKISEQFGKKDLEGLNALEKRVVKSLCPMLGINENVLHPFETVANILDQGDSGDSFASVFKAKWFLVRSSVMISDLTFAGADSSQELFLARQLDIPVIGMMPPSGQISPWQHQNTTVLYCPQNLQYLLSVIKGFTLNSF